jgi:hypothetical protein
MMGRGTVKAKRMRLGLGRDCYRPRRGEGKRRSEGLRPSMARRSPAAVTTFKGGPLDWRNDRGDW